MPIRYGTKPPKARKAPTKVQKGISQKQLEGLQAKMEKALTLDLKRGITALQSSVDPGTLERAVRSGDYKKVMRKLPMDAARTVMDDSSGRITQAAIGASKITIAHDLPKSIARDLRFDAKNPAIAAYVDTRIGSLIQNVSDNTQLIVQANIRRTLTSGDTASDVAANIKSTIGLNERQAAQYANFDGDPKEKADLLDRLTQQRAETVARTEVSFALNQGQLSVWNTATDQGLLPQNATKVWIVDAAPCPFICEPMNGVEVPLDEEFELPDGVTVMAPPAHPRCYCIMSLNIGDSPDTGSENYDRGDEDD